MAVELSLLTGKTTLGLFGPVPRRVSAETKLELMGLVDGAVAAGWAHARACRVLEIEDVRMHRWRARLAETGSLDDVRPIGDAVHRILAWEEQAILELIETWGPVDRSHRKLAHRGSYTGKVFVSPSTLLRVALKHRVQLPGERFRPRPPKPAFPEISLGKEPDLDLGRDALPTRQASRLRDRRRRHSLLGRLPAHQPSRRTPRCSCCSPARSRTRACSAQDGLAARTATRTRRSSSPGRTTGRR